MSDSENSIDDSMLEEVKLYGFESIDWEDRGAHGTIFDDFDTLAHFERVKKFQNSATQLLAGGENAASDLVFILEDLNPRLFWTLAAAFAALDKATTEEEVAQASLSGRRFVEQLADVLFPPRDSPHNGRPVGKPNYRNRIWAFIADNTDSITTKQIGGEIDRLDIEFNAGLHGNRDMLRLRQAFADLSVVSGNILSLNPSAARKPYFAHTSRMTEMFKEWASDH